MYSIAAASVIAKVTRDRIMMQLHLSYPLYNFAQHKGYPTLAHRNALLRHGPCAIHRLTFGPVKASIKSEQAVSPKIEKKSRQKVASLKHQAKAKLKNASKGGHSARNKNSKELRRSERLSAKIAN